MELILLPESNRISDGVVPVRAKAEHTERQEEAVACLWWWVSSIPIP